MKTDVYFSNNLLPHASIRREKYWEQLMKRENNYFKTVKVWSWSSVQFRIWGKKEVKKMSKVILTIILVCHLLAMGYGNPVKKAGKK